MSHGPTLMHKKYFKPSVYLVGFLEMSSGESAPTAALFLEPDISLIQYETEKRQLAFLKRILDRQNDNPVKII